VPCLDALIGTDVAVNAQFDSDLTLLMWSSGYSHEPMVGYLLGHGAGKQAKDNRGLTALEMAGSAGRALVIAALAALGGGSGGVVLAQTLPEVVVSASRAEQLSFDAPAGIQSVARTQIQSGGPQVNLSEALKRVPGLTILERQNYAQDLQLSIRGFGARSAFGIRGIRLLVDGIPATTPDGQAQSSSISLTSTDRIEVLRGPLAQLYGNSAGGVIQSFSKTAPKETALESQQFLGSYGLRRANYQFGDTLGAYAIVADYSLFSIDGYRDNAKAERRQFNAKLSFDPTEDLGVSVIFNQFDMPVAQDPLGLTRENLIANPAMAGAGAGNYFVRKTVLQNQLGASANYRFSQHKSVLLRSYFGTRDNLQYQVGTPGANVSGAWTGLARNYYGLGLQYNAKELYGGVPVQWVSGYEFDRAREQRQSGAASLGQKSTTTRNEDNQSENSDFYVQGTALVNGSLSAVFGFRHSTVRFTSDDYYLKDGLDGSGNKAYSAVNPVVGVTFHATDDLNIYANYGRGFETPTLSEMAYKISTPGSTTPVAEFNPGLNASVSRHFELGAKWVIDSRARLDLALYKIDTADEIVVAVSSGGRTAYKNAPGTSRMGWELAATALLTPTLSTTLSASGIDAQYAESFQSEASGVITKVTSGNKIPGIAQTSLFSELVWSSQAKIPGKTGEPLGARVSVELSHSGRLFANDTNTASADGHTVVNLSASHRWLFGKLAVSLFGRLNNLLDESYVGSVIVNQSALQFYEPGLPKNWSLGLRLSAPL